MLTSTLVHNPRGLRAVDSPPSPPLVVVGRGVVTVPFRPFCVLEGQSHNVRLAYVHYLQEYSWLEIRYYPSHSS